MRTGLLLSMIFSTVAWLFVPSNDARAEDMSIEEIISTLEKAIQENNDPMRNRMFFKLRALGKKATQPLVELLKSDEPAGVAEYAAFTLSWIADPAAIDPLLAFLERGNSNQKQKALYALGNMAWGTDEKVRKAVHSKAIDPMIAYLSSTDLAVLREAAYALGLAGDPKAIQHLEPLKKHPNKVISFMAGEAIDRIQSVNRSKS